VSDLHLYSPKVVRSTPLRSYSRTTAQSISDQSVLPVDRSISRTAPGARWVRAKRCARRTIMSMQRTPLEDSVGLGGTGAVSMRHKQALLRLIRAAKANRHGGNLHHWREARLVDPHCGLCFAPRCTACAAPAVSCVLAKASRVQRLKGTLGYACGAPNGSKVGFRALASLRREAVDACERRREW
jgi:hypothetical protein